MAKQKPQISIEMQSTEPMTLHEFCVLLSNHDRRVELIGAFNFSETQSGRIKDTATEFKSRFDAFVNAKPV